MTDQPAGHDPELRRKLAAELRSLADSLDEGANIEYILALNTYEVSPDNVAYKDWTMSRLVVTPHTMAMSEVLRRLTGLPLSPLEGVIVALDEMLEEIREMIRSVTEEKSRLN